MKKRIFGAPSIPEPPESDSDTEFQPTYVQRTRNNKQNRNLYNALLNDSADDTEERDLTGSERDSFSGGQCLPTPAPVQKKKKNKKKKSRNREKQTECNEVDEIVQAVNEILGAPDAVEGAPEAAARASEEQHPSVPPILRLDQRGMNVVNEIKKTYRVDVVKEFDNPPERKRNGWARRTTFVYQKKGWRPVRNTDLHMKLLRTDEAGVKYFAFGHGTNYKRTQLQYLQVVYADDRVALEQLLHDNPFHIDSRLLVAHVDGMLKRYAESKENIEFALFIMEHVFHKQFDYASGNCRLLYRHFENRAFLILLMKLVRYHYNLACHRTALEICKLILVLDPSDPLGVTLVIDAVALRAKEFTWLVQAIEYWDEQHRALSLPSMAFANALAHYNLETDEGARRAEVLLADAMRKTPSCALHVLEKCGSMRAREVRELPLFRKHSERDTGAVLWCLSRLAAERQFPVWKWPRNLAWLETVAARVGAELPDGETLRGRRAVFRRPPPPLLRHLTVLNHSRVAPPNTDTESAAFPVTDPYPPPDGVSPYNIPANPYTRSQGNRPQLFNIAQFL